MNETIKTINSRRSVRAYKDNLIPKEDIKLIVEAGQNAPNSFGRQDFSFFVISNMDVINKLATITSRYMGGTYLNHNFFGSKQIILVAASRNNPARFSDCGCAMENMMLAAWSLGIGSVWINQFFSIRDEEDVVTYFKELGISPDKVVCAICALGYPNEEPEPKTINSKVVYID